MYDATGVRLQAGRQAEVWCHFLSFPFLLCNFFFFSVCCLRLLCIEAYLCSFSLAFFSEFYWIWINGFSQVLNQIVYELPSEHPLAERRPLHELLGHTPPQVIIFHFNVSYSYNYLMDLRLTNEIQFTIKCHCLRFYHSHTVADYVHSEL